MGTHAVPGDWVLSVTASRPAKIARSYPSDLRAAPRTVRLSLLAALCWVRSAEITDALVDLLIGLVHKINARADRRVERELIDELRRVRGKEAILFRLAEAAVEHPDDAGRRRRQRRDIELGNIIDVDHRPVIFAAADVVGRS